MTKEYKKYNFDFVGKMPYAVAISSILAIATLVLLFTKGLNYGVDFKGGAEVQVKFAKDVDLGKLRETIGKGGFSGAAVQAIGDEKDLEFIIKVKSDEKNLNQVTDAMTKLLGENFKEQGVDIKKTDIVGPKAGQELRTAGFLSIIWSVLAIMIYVGLRFDFKYAPGAALSLIHDAVIMFGFYIVTGMEFNLASVAAILSVIGYSVNDTVVVYDRVRENEQKLAGVQLIDHINNSLNETLARTILTSAATFGTTVIVAIFGGAVLRDFFISMSFGIAIGTYSTLYIAAPATLWLDKFETRRRQSKKTSVATA